VIRSISIHSHSLHHEKDSSNVNGDGDIDTSGGNTTLVDDYHNHYNHHHWDGDSDGVADGHTTNDPENKNQIKSADNFENDSESESDGRFDCGRNNHVDTDAHLDDVAVVDTLSGGNYTALQYDTLQYDTLHDKK
jgi:hypothetical protein